MKTQVLTVIAASLLLGCTMYTKTRYTQYRGPSEFVGTGGTVRTVDGIDVWETGSPDRKYKVIGLIQQDHYDNNSMMSALAGATKDSAVVAEAKKHGGQAIIILDSSSRITGYSTTANAQSTHTGTYTGTSSGTLTGFSSGSTLEGQYSGTHQGHYSGSTSTFGTARTRANTKERKSIAVIQYIE